MMGLSRDTCYRDKSAAEEGGVDALFDSNRRQPNLKNRIDPAVGSVVVECAVEEPAHGQTRASNERRKRGTFVSPSGIRGIWLRHNLACFKDRLKALEALVAQEGRILTESQMAAMERKQQDDEAAGEIEIAHPGYLGSQDKYYVGTFKDLGRVYQLLPFYEEQELPVLRILTDRGTAYCGKAEQHDYPLSLLLNDSEHTRTKVKSPQTHGICERFH